MFYTKYLFIKTDIYHYFHFLPWLHFFDALFVKKNYSKHGCDAILIVKQQVSQRDDGDEAIDVLECIIFASARIKDISVVRILIVGDQDLV